MALLCIIKGPNQGQRFLLNDTVSVIGRQPDATVYLESLAVSRQHARITRQGNRFLIEDLGSSNGTFLNDLRIAGPVNFTEQDTLRIGPYELQLIDDTPPTADSAQIIRARIEATSSNQSLFAQNPAYKLQMMLQIAQDLGQNLEVDFLLGRLLEHLLRLFPVADRGMALVCEGEQLLVRAQRTRHQGAASDFPYSRTIVRKALEEGVGLLSEDVPSDRVIRPSETMMSMRLRSFLCVPLLGWENRRLGVLQLDCLRQGVSFKPDDLELLTAIALQVSVVLQNAAYHIESLREQRLRQEIRMAREIQQQFLPDAFNLFAPSAEVYARCIPAREVSGDLYDFFKLPDGRVAFFVGDVSGKGMPAALFMIAVRTLARHLGPTCTGAADLLSKLNLALTADNPTHLFVTLLYGIYDGQDGSVLLANGGHLPPLLRKRDGSVQLLQLPRAPLLGSLPGPLRIADARLVLEPGEVLFLYTDGFVEATAPDGKTEFTIDGLRNTLSTVNTSQSLEGILDQVVDRLRKFTAGGEQQDDQTMLLLRRK